MNIVNNTIQFVVDFLKVDRIALLVLILFAFILSFFRINEQAIDNWDEARQGVNAQQMLHNHDYVNFYYEDGKVDTWNAKPPLMIWAIVGSYKIFGENVFALRFPSIICGILYLLVCYKTIRLYKSVLFAFTVCLSIMCCKALFGQHLALTGDFDAMLMLFLGLSIYSFLQYIDFAKGKGLLFFFIFLGLAFYTKGPASFVFLPSMFIYVLYKQHFKEIFTKPLFYVGIVFYLLIVGSWFYLSTIYGAKFGTDAIYKDSSSSIEVLFYHDIIERFAANTEESGSFEKTHNYLYFVHVLDSRLNVWNYLFYISLALIIFKYFKNKQKQSLLLKLQQNQLLVIAIIFVAPLSLFLSVVTNAYNWYLAPVFIFVMIITFYGLQPYKHINWFQNVIILVFVFTGVRHLIAVSNPNSNDIQSFVKTNIDKISHAKQIEVESPSQSLFLYLKYNCKNVKIVDVQFTQNQKSTSEKLLITKVGESYFIK